MNKTQSPNKRTIQTEKKESGTKVLNSYINKGDNNMEKQRADPYTNTNMNKTNQFKTPPNKTKKIEKTEQIKVELNLDNSIPNTNTTNPHSMRKPIQTATINHETEENSPWQEKEIVFRIKLTEPEYKLLLKEKAKFAFK